MLQFKFIIKQLLLSTFTILILASCEQENQNNWKSNVINAVQGDVAVVASIDFMNIINKSDLITDFKQGEDSINFSNFSFTAIQQGDGIGSILGYEYDETTDITTIHDANSDFELQLAGNIELNNSDFSFLD